MRGLITALAFFSAVAASGQIYIDSYRFAGASGDLLLDSFSGAAAAYSLRLLSTAYTGNALTVTKDNGDTTLIGFNGGYLDTTAMKTFCGTGAGDSCRVRRWFDQSGNGRNFQQTTFASQPLIMANGVALRDKGEVSLRFDGSDDWMEIPSSTAMFNFVHDGSDATFFSVQRFGTGANPAVAYTLLDNTGNASANHGFWLSYDDRASAPRNDAHLMFVTRAVSGFPSITMIENDRITPNAIGLLYMKIDADNATAADRARGGFNGSSDYGNNTNTGAPSASNATFNLALGALGNPASRILPLLGAVQELIIYNADQSSNRAAIETNINNFYNIY